MGPCTQLPPCTRAVRFWDLAATEPGPAAPDPDPDYTVGLRLELHEPTGTFHITDIQRSRASAGAVEALVAETAEQDGRDVEILIEQEPGAAGRAVTDRYKRHVLRGYTVSSPRPTGAKDVRARPAAENGLIKIVRGPNSTDLLDELCSFPHAPHDDCVDALAGAHHALARPHVRMRTHVPQGRIDEHAVPTRSSNRTRAHFQREADEHARLAAEQGLPNTYPRAFLMLS